ncbi:TPA: nucleoside-diphosphate sugar epimerase [Acinetobacter nosocomialis]|jgi:mitochondrial fission protein ELM1|uniref:Nucleoside-diphosphate sugar epimerase n=2 Tax=Acinetobacter nosocomialis TaxID=106654 RepID=K9BI02_ACINO|nr:MULTISPECIES: ELM1/GtrOC1 family putative glycosyltransferase [Acinetobacter]MDQ9823322.1 ELM1/GtrOC1 family putative glycosyltransferase [Acinetobacter sp. 163]ARG15793.1 nucleoside-diphosphate sugar epimerase [Acinetobacter nosocomialis]AVF43086.1 nucleoside-diphosphate sugar epimerase [Acinetobacter nosocomialis]AWL18077.1 nucleoside-diphosphate sugar epimerase [Acinetobacter nosocomialis]EHU1209948.1 mitochondrial fission ELM1 family protein [Acinetobacter nosocomialis]
MHIVYVSDGKAGHRSQALGLFQAMQRQQANATFEEVSINDLPIISLIKALFSSKTSLLQQAPDFIFGVGSHTHFRVWLLGKVFKKANTVILMKPNLPIAWFDYAVIPEHDGILSNERVIVTRGALNPIRNENRHQAGRILIALGGSSKRHQWNHEKVLLSVQKIVECNSNSEIILTTSRRTPVGFTDILKQQSFAKRLQICPVEQTPQGWIFEEMQKAEAVWVTEDSVSMIYEALTAGCRVGVIAMDRLKQDRITNSVDILLEKKLIANVFDINLLPEGQVLQEADRVVYQLTK